MRGSGEIGRHARLKNECPEGRGGSSPPSRILEGVAKVYGPYVQDAKKGRPRRFVILAYEDGTKRTMAYARYLWCSEHGDPPEGYEVHHLNGDRMDDRLENLGLAEAAEHRRMHAPVPAVGEFTCPECGVAFARELHRVRPNQRGGGGPYCGKACAGRANQRLQRTLRGGYPGPGSQACM